MRSWKSLAAAVLFGISGLSASAGDKATGDKAPVDNGKAGQYIVHEWGTFTSFNGSDGVSLDFRPLLGSHLPSFVMDRQEQADMLAGKKSIPPELYLGKATISSRQRMETPVTYFYTDRERVVNVRVDFPKGLLTEFYPPVNAFAPAYVKDQAPPLEGGSLQWTAVKLLTPEAVKSKYKSEADALPPCKLDRSGEHYAAARETDSAVVELTPPGSKTAHREKFLFYRGAGNFHLPLSVTASAGGRFRLENTGVMTIPFAMLVSNDGGTLRYAMYHNIGGAQEMAFPAEPAEGGKLEQDLHDALVAEGLYPKEAAAMVKTWKSSWLGEPGTRVLYGLPQRYTDALLPLRIEPRPQEMVRIMVGRLEILTPEQEQRIEKVALELASPDPAARQKAQADILKMGRFAEPALNRVAALSQNPQIQAVARNLVPKLLTAEEATLNP